VATYSVRVPKGSRLLVEALVTPSRPKDAPADSGPVLEFERLPAPETKVEGDVEVVTQKVAFAPFATGTLSLPGPHLTLVAPDGSKTSLVVPAATLTIDSRLPASQPKEKLAPRPERPVRIPRISPWWFVAAGLLAAAVAAAVVLFLRRRRRGTAEEEAKVEAIAAGPELLAALERLEKEAERLGPDPRAWYSDLTHVVKRYLERRLDLPVLEWTTFETVRHLRDAALEPPREAALPELLSAADHVKFGKGAATREAAREHLRRARLLHDGLEAELTRRDEVRAAEEKRREKAKEAQR
jgi:hypothetical protein